MNPAFSLLALLAAAPQDRPLPDGAAILALDLARADAEAAHDPAALARTLDIRFAATFDADRAVLDRDAYLQRIARPPRGPATRADLSDRTLKVDGDAAVLFETQTTFAMGQGGMPVGTTRRVTVTFLRREGGWRVFTVTSVAAPTIP